MLKESTEELRNLYTSVLSVTANGITELKAITDDWNKSHCRAAKSVSDGFSVGIVGLLLTLVALPLTSFTFGQTFVVVGLFFAVIGGVQWAVASLSDTVKRKTNWSRIVDSVTSVVGSVKHFKNSLNSLNSLLKTLKYEENRSEVPHEAGVIGTTVVGASESGRMIAPGYLSKVAAEAAELESQVTFMSQFFTAMFLSIIPDFFVDGKKQHHKAGVTEMSALIAKLDEKANQLHQNLFSLD